MWWRAGLFEALVYGVLLYKDGREVVAWSAVGGDRGVLVGG